VRGAGGQAIVADRSRTQFDLLRRRSRLECDGVPKLFYSQNLAAENSLQKDQKLDLSNAGLKELPADLFERVELRFLNAYQNEVSFVPPEIGRLASLETVILANNRLTKLPEQFGLLVQLKTLDLGHNQIAELPGSFANLENLSDYLYLHDNRLQTLPEGIFERLTKLRYLNLSDNPLQHLPESLGALASLEEVRLENISLEKVSALDRPTPAAR